MKTLIFVRWRILAAAFLFLTSTALGSATTLEVLTLGSIGKEFEQWGTTFTVSAPQVFTFRWSPTVKGATSAAWEVTTKNMRNGTVIVAKGTLTQAPATGKWAYFDIDSFLSATPLSAKQKYFVRITSQGSQGPPLGDTSAPVSITHVPPSPPVQFDADLGGTPLGYTEPGHPKIRFIRYDPLTQNSPGKLELEVYHGGGETTQPVSVRITDGHLVVRQEGAPIQVPALQKHQRKFITFTLRPQLTKGQPTVEADWEQWRARAETGFRILAGSAKTDSPYVQWQQPWMSGRTSSIVCGLQSPASSVTADAKIRDCVEDRMRALMANSDGSKGFLLKRVGGLVLAAENEETVFEPASAIKVLINLNAFRRMEADSSLTLSTPISWFQNYVKDGAGKDTSCPTDTGPGIEPLQMTLNGMMKSSDNRRTQALRAFFGQNQINVLAQSLGMSNTLIQHRIGCGSGAIASPNRLTLADAAILYEGVADGSLLSNANRTSFYSVMLGGPAGNALQTIAKEEAPDGMPAAKVQSFIDEMADHFKPGVYSLSTGHICAIAGSFTIPFREGSNVVPRDFVYGAFVNAASASQKASVCFTVSNELARELIHDALLSW